MNNLFGFGGGLLSEPPAPSLYSEEMKRLVFAKARPHAQPGFAYDENGKLIFFGHYGDRNSIFGWEYDHWPMPVAYGGPGELWNLRPLNCYDNAANQHGRALAKALINSTG